MSAKIKNSVTVLAVFVVFFTVIGMCQYLGWQ